jgi:hypothetical protein
MSTQYTDEDLKLKEYEDEYFKRVTTKLQKYQDKTGVFTWEKHVVVYYENIANEFWLKEKNEIANEEKLKSLKERLKRRRYVDVRRISNKMGIDSNGNIYFEDDYHDRNPLLGAEEESRVGHPTKKPRLLEWVWDIHRELCPKIPFLTIGYCSKAAGDHLFELNKLIQEHIVKFKVKPRKDKVHKGYAIASTVTGGGSYSKEEDDKSGSIGWSDDFKKDEPLQTALLYALSDVIVSAFGTCIWFMFVNHFLRTNENPHFSDRLIPGLPVTNAWMNVGTTPYDKHVDTHNFLVAFLLVPYTVPGSELVVTDPEGKVKKAIHVQKYVVVAGRCFQCQHYNLEKKVKYPVFLMLCIMITEFAVIGLSVQNLHPFKILDRI